MKTVTLREALGIIDDTTIPFDIEFSSFDRNRKEKTSKIIKLGDCIKTGANHNRKKNNTVVISRTDRKDHPYTVHIHLITAVNGQQVVI